MTIRVPVLQQGKVLIVSVQDALSDSDLLNVQQDLLDKVFSVNATGVVIDVSALDVLDSFGTRTLSDIAAAIQLRGAKTVIVGIQADVAMSMVLLGLSLPRVATALDLEAGMALLGQRHVA
ncbi:STAS domain-containing protein [Pararhodobacter zhoushanensis]|uniref:STAS domain-containing protein n=1 Tax=Pararhodobacter zhoushanensis TaxID=2479545 RepID=UPI001C70A529|nr:STAS domain-containing protein [Pararhodobacter zhoushanensis]